MIDPRPASGLLVSAMIRRVQSGGGSAMVLAKGDAIAGAIILILADRGVTRALVERVWRFDGHYGLEPVGPADLSSDAIGAYIERRRKSDPDLWVVELDHPDAGQIADDLQI